MAGSSNKIDVIGAGPAGLVAAINLAKAGFKVTLHEAAPWVGHRFHGDFQGIENWTTESDVRARIVLVCAVPTCVKVNLVHEHIREGNLRKYKSHVR